MAMFCRSLFNNGNKLILPVFRRNITLSPVSQIKEIMKKKVGNTLILEGVIKQDPNKDRIFRDSDTGNACSLCALGLEVKHTDVLIISQFLRPDGCMLPRRVTGLCSKQQKRMESVVAMAQKAGLLSQLTPHWSYKDPKKRAMWKRYNSYYDETTINHPRSKYYNVLYRYQH